MTQAAEVDPLLEPPELAVDELVLDELVLDEDVDGVLELEDSFDAVPELLPALSEDEDVLRESLR